MTLQTGGGLGMLDQVGNVACNGSGVSVRRGGRDGIPAVTVTDQVPAKSLSSGGKGAVAFGRLTGVPLACPLSKVAEMVQIAVRGV
ncbi:MAG: hypothetical protein AAF530_19730 [Pseudomonadota bacterium]